MTSTTSATALPPLGGKIAVITGANQGVGLGIAQEFIDQGAQVVITGRRQVELDNAVNELGPQASAVRADVSLQLEMQQMYETVIDRHRRLDAVVANAGVGDSNPLGKITEEQFEHIININLKGVLFTVQLALPRLPRDGTVVIIGSTASIQGLPGMAVYGSAKAGLRGALRAWIQDIKGTGIRINILSPGAIDTPSLRKALADASGESSVDDGVKQMGERATPSVGSEQHKKLARPQPSCPQTRQASSPESSSSLTAAWPSPGSEIELNRPGCSYCPLTFIGTSQGRTDPLSICEVVKAHNQDWGRGIRL